MISVPPNRAQFAEAYAALRDRRVLGKVLLCP